MKKKRNEKNCSSKMEKIAVPKGCQQPRTRSRPRTDFSPFLSTSTPSSADAGRPRCRPRPHRRLSFEFSICKDTCSSITTTTADQGCHASFTSLEEKNCEFPPMQLSVSPDGGHGSLISCREVACTEDESEVKCAPLDTCDNWNNGGYMADHIFPTAEALSCTPEKTAFEVAESDGAIWLVPGCLVWAKTVNNTWWPAEVMGERASTDDENAGRILVEFYGSHDHAWIDPEHGLSHFEDCYKERSCNPSKMFQHALKRALHKKQNLTFCKLWDRSPDMPVNWNHEEQSSDKCNTSSSSRVEDHCHDGGRGKRKRKPKVHFDEVTVPVKTKKKGRRLRIMRHLGLVAPPGSPFALASHVRTAC